VLRALLTRAFLVEQTKDSYLPYNKPMSIIHWLQNAQPQADVIIIMDPDCLMFKPIDIVRWPLSATIRVWLTPLQVVEQGRPIAQKAFFDFHRAASDGDRTCPAPWHVHTPSAARLTPFADTWTFSIDTAAAAPSSIPLLSPSSFTGMYHLSLFRRMQHCAPAACPSPLFRKDLERIAPLWLSKTALMRSQVASSANLPLSPLRRKLLLMPFF
jgi:hypothetical protein